MRPMESWIVEISQCTNKHCHPTSVLLRYLYCKSTYHAYQLSKGTSASGHVKQHDHGTSWYIMVHHGTSWYIMVHHGTSWYIMVRYATSWYIMVHHGTSWYIMVRYATSWYIMVHHGTSWYIMVHHSTSWYILSNGKRQSKNTHSCMRKLACTHEQMNLGNCTHNKHSMELQYAWRFIYHK
jgi:hypothetical protein